MAEEGKVIEGSYRLDGERLIEPQKPKTRIIFNERFGIYLVIVAALAMSGLNHH